MRGTLIYAIALVSLGIMNATASVPNENQTAIAAILQNHFNKYTQAEYFSGIALSIYIPQHLIENYSIGKVSHEKNSRPLSANTLFEIGSITKSFTAAILLQLEEEKKLTLNDTLAAWLPNYPAWSTISIKALLNMTSGLPNYSDSPLMSAEGYNHPTRVWSNEELIRYAASPDSRFPPPLKSGYFYSNTGYLLADLIIQKATGHSYHEALQNRLIKRAGLTNTFYPLPHFSTEEYARLAHGYNYNPYDNAWLVGKDVTNTNLSWAGAAGALIATPEDVIKWVKALFIDNHILSAAAKQKMEQLVSIDSGKPIAKVSRLDTHGFGLGVAQSWDKDRSIDRYWFYEGQTLGFRALYAYVPCSGIIVSAIFNSSTNRENDHAGELMQQTMKYLLAKYPSLACKPRE